MLSKSPSMSWTGYASILIARPGNCSNGSRTDARKRFMADQIRVYAVSIMAFSQLHENAPAGGTYVEHIPGLVPAHSIEDAADRAKEKAFERWPIDQTWYGHQAAIEPVTNAFFDVAIQAYKAGEIDSSDAEQPAIFQFDI